MCFTNMASVCSIRSTFSCWWCSCEQLHPHCYLIDAAAAEAAALSTNHVGLTETWPPGSCVCVFCRKTLTSYFPRLGFCFPAKIFRAVDLPIPLVPTSPSTSPGRGMGSLRTHTHLYYTPFTEEVTKPIITSTREQASNKQGLLSEQIFNFTLETKEANPNRK